MARGPNVSHSLSTTPLADFKTDVTLADEDTKSILADNNANRACGNASDSCGAIWWPNL